VEKAALKLPSILVTLTAMLLVHGMGVSLLGRRAGGSVATH
jgi:hypothetical protein